MDREKRQRERRGTYKWAGEKGGWTERKDREREEEHESGQVRRVGGQREKTERETEREDREREEEHESGQVRRVGGQREKRDRERRHRERRGT